MLIIAAVLLFFLVLPCAFVTYMLFKRKNVHDFGGQPTASDGAYRPYWNTITSDMQFVRSLPYEEQSVSAKDGVRLCANWYPNGNDRTLILLHGFCSTPLNNFSTIARAFYGRGYNLLMVWQRGHGKSGGKYTTLGLTESEDLLLWIDRVRELVPGGSIGVYGISMGGATVCYASDRLDPKCVKVLGVDCCYCSPHDQMCKGKGIISVVWAPLMPLVWLFAKLLMGVNIRRHTYDSLKNARIPAVFMIGLADKKVPPRLFRANYEFCASDKELIEVPGAPHALAFVAANGEQREKLIQFIDHSFRADAEK